MTRLIKRFTQEIKERNLQFTGFAALVCTFVFSILVFFGIYNVFIDTALYNERLNQMENVTKQLFTNLEFVVQNQWQSVNAQHNDLKNNPPKTVDELLAYMKEQSEEFVMSEQHIELMAVDSLGRYYTNKGRMGKLADMSYFADSPEYFSFDSTPLLYNDPMVNFLKRLSEPLVLTDGDTTAEIIYYGLSEHMAILQPYLECDAYDGINTVYVLNDQGFRLFHSGHGKIFQSYNLFNKLSQMEYLHGTSFEDTKQKLLKDGVAYSNAIIDGTEYYYALRKMENTRWILLFLVPSECVASNTVVLIQTTVHLVLVFSVFLGFISALVIFIIMRLQQRKALVDEHNANELLTQVNQKLEAAVRDADAANRAKSDFLANMSHDIRTPMNAIIGITTLMEHEPELSEKMHSYIHKVQLSSRHLLGLINDVLDMSKIESSEITLNAENVSLSEQIRQIDCIIRPQTTERSQNFKIQIHDIAHEYLFYDGVRLRQVLLNLLSNAVKFTPEHGSITFDIREMPYEKPNYALFVFTVSDTGCGMTPEFISHIFEPFVRAESSIVNKVPGTGLGMAIAKSIVDLMGGTIDIESEPHIGSRFTVRVPLLIQTGIKTADTPHNILIVSEDASVVENLYAATRNKPVKLIPVTEITEFSEMPDKKSVDIILFVGASGSDIAPGILTKLRRMCSEELLIFGVDYPSNDKAEAAFDSDDTDGFLRRPVFYSDLEAAIEKAHAKRNPDGTHESILQGLHFLCAEDNKLNAEILQTLLSMKGASCTFYADGKALVDAFETVQPGEYDAILMDVQMPKLNGLEAAKAIRNSANPQGASIPIIAMTANAFSEDVRRSLASGMNAHISKPIDIALLEKILKTLLSDQNDETNH